MPGGADLFSKFHIDITFFLHFTYGSLFNSLFLFYFPFRQVPFIIAVYKQKFIIFIFNQPACGFNNCNAFNNFAKKSFFAYLTS